VLGATLGTACLSLCLGKRHTHIRKCCKGIIKVEFKTRGIIRQLLILPVRMQDEHKNRYTSTQMQPGYLLLVATEDLSNLRLSIANGTLDGSLSPIRSGNSRVKKTVELTNEAGRKLTR
jgi:hypothetical protein